ncbi:MAG: hypothetical protein JNK29_08775 [Anaerolineales bacterium]|nr:hypothetical protein [Anaerolineales bacterium]
MKAPPGRALGLALALSLAAVAPLAGADFPATADGYLHILRAIELDHLIRAGEWWPRLAPDLAYGYGYPVFNFHPPWPHYLLVAGHALGLTWAQALQAALALGVLMGAWGAFQLAAAVFETETAGVLAAAAFVCGPYTLYNVYQRGALPELWGTALLAVALWALRALCARPGPGPAARLALAYGLLLVTHNPSALVNSAVLGLWLAGEWLGRWRAERRVTAAWAVPALALCLGAGLGAWGWLPAFAERGATQVAAAAQRPGFTFRDHWLDWPDLAAPPFVFDPGLQQPPVPITLGLIPLAAGALGLAAGLRRSDWRARALALAALTLALAGFTVGAAAPAWERLPLLQLIICPWRLLGPATVALAALTGAAAAGRPPRWAGLLIAGLAVAAVPWTYFIPAHLDPEPDLSALAAFERESGALGTTSLGELLPRSVAELPAPDSLAERYAAGPIIDRLERAGLPDGVAITSVSGGVLTSTVDLTAAVDFTATFLWFDFPGWQAAVDGQPAPITPSVPHGLITVAVPAGARQVRVWFGTTPARTTAGWLSGVSLAALAVLLAADRRRARAAAGLAPEPGLARLVVALSVILAGARLGLAERAGLFHQPRFNGVTVAGAVQTLSVDFGGRLGLIGLDPPAPTPADQPLAFTLYWRPAAALTEDYSVTAQVWDAAGHLLGQQDQWHPGGLPTRQWRVDGYAAAAHALTLYPGTPPGRYRLLIGVYPAGGGDNLEVRDALGRPLGRFYEAGGVEVLAPERLPSEAELQPAQALAVDLGPVRVLGVDGLGRAAAAGDAVPVVLYYRLTGPAPAGAGLLLELADAAAVLPLASLPLTASPVVRQPLTVLIPPEASGPAEVRVSLADAAGGRLAGPAVLGALAVRAPARSYAPPAPATPLALRLGAGADLLGFDLAGAPAQPGGTLTVTLYWRAAARLTTAYTVFVHLLGPDGGIAAQVDEAPAQGARPTTGWLPPEVIADVHTLTLPAELPPGDYSLTAGLYDPRSGARLTVRDAAGQPLGDAVPLATVALAAGPP